MNAGLAEDKSNKRDNDLTATPWLPTNCSMQLRVMESCSPCEYLLAKSGIGRGRIIQDVRRTDRRAAGQARKQAGKVRSGQADIHMERWKRVAGLIEICF